jgi:hypothetical protein
MAETAAAELHPLRRTRGPVGAQPFIPSLRTGEGPNVSQVIDEKKPTRH